jgi:hypothetical protein
MFLNNHQIRNVSTCSPMLRFAKARANALTATMEIGTPSEDGDGPPNYQRELFHAPTIRDRTC